MSIHGLSYWLEVSYCYFLRARSLRGMLEILYEGLGDAKEEDVYEDEGCNCTHD